MTATTASAAEGSAPTRRARFRAAIGLGLAAVALLCFALPVSLYLGNRAEFEASWPALVAPLLPAGVLAALAFAGLCALLPPREFPGAIVLAATLVVLAWVQAYLLVWEYGLFDGGQIDWSRDRWRGWVDATLWIGTLIATFAWRHRLVRVLPRIAVVICLLQAAFVAASLAMAPPDAAPAHVAAMDDDVAGTLAGFSPEGNVLHIVADGLQTDVVEDLLAEDRGRLGGELDGFVFFEDHLGSFLSTDLAVPTLIGGRMYDNSQTQGRFLDAALGHGSILGAAKAAGYDVEIGMPAGGIEFVYWHAVDARLMTLPDSRRGDGGANRESLLLADLTLFRAVPHFTKRIVHNDQAWLLQPALGGSIPVGHVFLAHEALLRDVAARMSATRPRPTYKVVHVMLSHRPAAVNRDCSDAGRVLEMDRVNVGNQARCGMRAVLALLGRMRELGIYDDATIVISGDHGAFLAPSAFAPGTAALAEAERRQYPPRMIGQARPALLVKPPHAQGALRRSQAPSSMVDTAATIADAAGIPGTFPGTSVLRLEEGVPRVRYFYFHKYDVSNWQSDHLPSIIELIVDGRTDDVGAWQIGRTFGPPVEDASP